MAKERLKSPRARLFIALDLPAALRAGIARWGKRELQDPALRAVPEESLHITLAFLGYMPEREIEALAEIVSSLRRPAPVAELGDPVAKPSLRRARLFVLPVESPAIVSLQAELQEKLVAARLYKPEKRAFWPHVTAARVKSAGRGSRQPLGVSKPPGRLPKALLQATSCRRLALYRSELQPQGARYIPLAQVELSEDGRQ
ncbi:MAG TPA: RNA 2',3'-cyclic phosphodiesterase [Solirubrobacterales bacterium]|nr:RNA 2',3'-cyclic phosphodiesterase [Solirubrobacterales bacterium]